GSDYPLPLEFIEIGVAQSQPLTIDLAVVLAEQRRTLYFDRRIFELHRTSGHREFPAHRMVDRYDHFALAQMRVGEQLDTIEHRTARHPRLAHDFHHFLLGPGGGPFLDDFRQGFDILAALLAVGKAWIDRHLGLAHRRKRRLPHLLIRAVEVDIIVGAAWRAFENVAERS